MFERCSFRVDPQLPTPMLGSLLSWLPQPVAVLGLKVSCPGHSQCWGHPAFLRTGVSSSVFCFLCVWGGGRIEGQDGGEEGCFTCISCQSLIGRLACYHPEQEISPEYSLQGLILKLKLQYFGHLMRRADSLEKTLMLEKIEGGRRRGQQRVRWLDGITDSMDMSLSQLREGAGNGEGGLACCSPWGCKESDTTE